MRHGCVLYTVIFPQKRKVQFAQPFISVVSQQSRLERGRVPNVISWCLVLDQVISLDLRWWDWTIQGPLLQRTTLHCTKNWKVSLSPGRAGGSEAASLRKSWRRQRQSWDALELGTLCSECSQKLKLKLGVCLQIVNCFKGGGCCTFWTLGSVLSTCIGIYLSPLPWTLDLSKTHPNADA